MTPLNCWWYSIVITEWRTSFGLTNSYLEIFEQMLYGFGRFNIVICIIDDAFFTTAFFHLFSWLFVPEWPYAYVDSSYSQCSRLTSVVHNAISRVNSMDYRICIAITLIKMNEAIIKLVLSQVICITRNFEVEPRPTGIIHKTFINPYKFQKNIKTTFYKKTNPTSNQFVNSYTHFCINSIIVLHVRKNHLSIVVLSFENRKKITMGKRVRNTVNARV